MRIIFNAPVPKLELRNPSSESGACDAVNQGGGGSVEGTQQPVVTDPAPVVDPSATIPPDTTVPNEVPPLAPPILGGEPAAVIPPLEQGRLGGVEDMTYLYNDKKLKIYRKNLRNNMPEPEQLLWYHLRSKNLKGYKFRRQYSSGKYILDFYCPKVRLGIEIDGDSHYIDSKAKAYDKNRETFLESENIKILRFTNTEVRENIEAVVDKILEQLP